MSLENEGLEPPQGFHSFFSSFGADEKDSLLFHLSYRKIGPLRATLPQPRVL
jgi:hypothetical protein